MMYVYELYTYNKDYIYKHINIHTHTQYCRIKTHQTL